MMAMAFSMTRKASELKTSRETPPTQPIKFRDWMNPVSTSMRVGVKPGAMSETSAVMVSSSSASSMKCEKMTMSTADRGISESIML